MSHRRVCFSLLLIASALLWSDTAWADRHERIPPATHAPTVKACSDCHMLYPAEMLPKASWEKIMKNLDNHFGETATLPEGERQEITRYLTRMAGDGDGRAWGRKFLRGLSEGDAPMRISETPYFQRKHGKKLSAGVFKKEGSRSPANCPACHLQAAQGWYEE
ncbi:MAG: cytochrome C [Magnetococcales bacterium]|nr:cytochrome C [Magnetococcales bacterium]